MHAIPSTSNRILYDVPCVVCRDHSSGKHYGVFACDGCAGFFKRSVRRDRQYACKARAPGICLVDKAHRNQCRACRLSKCINAGMNKDAVQHERGPRNSTIRRQMAYFFRDQSLPSADAGQPNSPAMDLVLKRSPMTNILPPPPPPPLPTIPTVPYYPNPYESMYGGGLNSWSLAQAPAMVTMPSPPLISLAALSPAALREAGAKIVFMNINWARYVPGFGGLSISDRTVLLEESWKDLFILGLAQLIQPINIRAFIGPNQSIDTTSADILQIILSDIYRLHVDSNEYSCFRAVALYNYNYIITQTTRHIEDIAAIASLSSFYQLSLHQYELAMNPMDVSRFSNFIQILHKIKLLESNIIEELFLRGTIGDIPIKQLITEMYTTEKELLIF